MNRFLFSALILSHSVLAQVCDSLLLESITNQGPFSYAEYTEADGLRDGSEYDGATIYFPENTTAELASIIIVPGFMNEEWTVQNWGPFLASHGIVTMTIGTNGLTDTHIQRRDALLDAKITLIEENQRIKSPLFKRLNTEKLAVGGFSKGGGGAQMAAVADVELKAVIALYPWLESPTEEQLNHNAPVLIISGGLDFIAPPSQHADIHYDYTPITTRKLKYEIEFASHDATSGPNGGNGTVGIKVFSWLKTYLLNDPCYCPLFLIVPENSSQFTTNVECQSVSMLPYYNKTKKLIKVTDLLGREASPVKIYNQILLYIYSDGSIERMKISK